jgi:hypothetical protein
VARALTATVKNALLRAMMIDPIYQVVKGLYYFECVVTVELAEPLYGEGEASEDEDESEPAVGYYRSYVTIARGVADAASVIEDELGKEAAAKRLEGNLVELEIGVIDPETLDLDKLTKPVDERGIRFASDRIYFTASDEEEDEEDDDGDDDGPLR